MLVGHEVHGAGTKRNVLGHVPILASTRCCRLRAYCSHLDTMAPRYDYVSEDQLQRHDTAWGDERIAGLIGRRHFAFFSPRAHFEDRQQRPTGRLLQDASERGNGRRMGMNGLQTPCRHPPTQPSK